MLDREWRTLAEIARGVQGSEAAVSARLRDLRKPRYGGHTVNRKQRCTGKPGVYEYQLVVNPELLPLLLQARERVS